MLFQQTYASSSGVSHAGGNTLVNFAPDLGREPTFFRGKIADPIRYRDAMIALRDVVVSDLNYKPKDNGLELSPKPSNTGYVTGGSPTELQSSIESSVNEYASLGKSEIYDGGINSIEESNTIIGDNNE